MININHGAGNTVGGYDDITDLPGGGSGGTKLDGAFFDNNTYLEAQSGNLITQSYTYTLSFWYKIGSDLSRSEGNIKTVFNVQDCRCYFYGLKVWFLYEDDAMSLNVLSSAQDQSQSSEFSIANVDSHDDAWHHVAIYEQSYPNTSSVYIDGTSKTLSRTSSITRDIRFSFSNQWRIGAGEADSLERYNGCLDELYFTFDDFDISVAANLDKLISSTDLPRYLGQYAERPTGSQALIYLKDPGEAFNTNYGNLPVSLSKYGELPACEEPTETEFQEGCCVQVFDDPNIDCGWLIRNPQIMCEQTAATGAYFDGTTPDRVSVVVGPGTLPLATSNTMIQSLWFKVASGDAQTQMMLHGSWSTYYSSTYNDTEFSWSTTPSNRATIWSYMHTDSGYVELETTDALDSYFDSEWHHLLISNRADPQRSQIYIDNTAIAHSVTHSGTTTDPFLIVDKQTPLTEGNLIAQDDLPYTGCVDHFYFSTDEMDISDSDNRYLFNTGGQPADLGDNGEIPTGNIPLIYMYGENFLTNYGTGNDGTMEEGTLTSCP